jgi:imidazoleglycerol-phosphate dehydratase / histidinol-phosphatase
MQKPKKALFIDRDGTLIVEPTDNFQIDSLEKLEFLPFVLSSLQRIAHELVMVTNQDGLGTDSFPEDTFWPAHRKMMKTLENEGIHFANIHIDPTFEWENAPTRKPGTAMLKAYMQGDYDLAASFVLGDRLTDVQLAENLGSQAILLGGKTDSRAVLCTSDWREIADFLISPARKASVHRQTLETDIRIELDLDKPSPASLHTGMGFFDHILEQLGKHSGASLSVYVQGDLHIDEHHTIEDTALALGEAYRKALGNKRGIRRYGHFTLPMDDVLAQVAIDFSGRPWLVWQADFHREKVGQMPTEMFYHFFKSFSDAALCNLNIKVEGQNEHHKIEAIFKAFAKAIQMAVYRNPLDNQLPSTKGVL